MGQIEGPGDADDQGKTQGYEGIKRTQRKTGKDNGGPNPHDHLLLKKAANLVGGKGRGTEKPGIKADKGALSPSVLNNPVSAPRQAEIHLARGPFGGIYHHQPLLLNLHHDMLIMLGIAMFIKS